MACPLCKSQKFYIKDLDDEYDIHEFETRDGKVAGNEPHVDETREIYCSRCSWHGPLKGIR